MMSWRHHMTVSKVATQADLSKAKTALVPSRYNCILSPDQIQSGKKICPKCTDIIYLIRNRKHVLWFYQVIQTRVEVWKNEKCRGNMNHRRVFPQFLQVLPNFPECLYNSIETWRTCFLSWFRLENTTIKKETTC